MYGNVPVLVVDVFLEHPCHDSLPVLVSGIVCLLLTLLLLPACVYMKVNVQLVYTLLRQLLATHMVAAALIALVFYVKSFYSPRSQINPKVTGHFLLDFLVGREVSPRVGSVDVKSFFLRYGCTVTVVFNIVLMMRDVQGTKGGAYNYPLLLACLLQNIILIDYIWFEDGIYTMYDYNREGMGLSFTAICFFVPFYFALTTRFMLNYK